MQVWSLGQKFPWRREWQHIPVFILAWGIPMDRGTWWATVHRVALSQTGLKLHSTHAPGSQLKNFALGWFYPSGIMHTCFRWHLSETLNFRVDTGISWLWGLLGWSSEKAIAPHSSTLAWKIPWMEEPGRLQSMGSLRVGNDWETSFSLFIFMHWRRKWQPTPVNVFCRQ